MVEYGATILIDLLLPVPPTDSELPGQLRVSQTYCKAPLRLIMSQPHRPNSLHRPAGIASKSSPSWHRWGCTRQCRGVQREGGPIFACREDRTRGGLGLGAEGRISRGLFCCIPFLGQATLHLNSWHVYKKIHVAGIRGNISSYPKKGPATS